MNARNRGAATIISSAVIATVAALGATAPAYASGGHDDNGGHGGGGKAVRASSTCAGGSLKLKAKHDDGRIEVELELDTNRNAQRWSVRLLDDGVTVWKGKRTTHAPSGSFSVEKRIANRAGKDHLKVRVARGGTVCSARLAV
jgi:hypothetical protein